MYLQTLRNCKAYGIRITKECNDNKVQWIKSWGASQRVQNRDGWSQRIEGARRGLRVETQVLEEDGCVGCHYNGTRLIQGFNPLCQVFLAG